MDERYRILVVDDDARSRSLLDRYFNEQGSRLLPTHSKWTRL